MIYKNQHGAYLELETITSKNCHFLKKRPQNTLTILWFQDGDSHLLIDHEKYQLDTNDVICLTEFHRVQVIKAGTVRMVSFNRQFYCILDHDADVGCKGALFFGAAQLPRFNIGPQEEDKFNTLWHMFSLEIQSPEHLQLDMLQMMLKRLLILCARLYREQRTTSTVSGHNSALIREFNYLVELHFRKKHTVADYAAMLHKSPKTISNTFKRLGDKTALQYIHDRRMLEARRLLGQATLQITEAAFQVGFDDIQSFSRFFKRHQGVSPKEYRQAIMKGKIANS